MWLWENTDSESDFRLGEMINPYLSWQKSARIVKFINESFS
jgi:hypothetical protein